MQERMPFSSFGEEVFFKLCDRKKIPYVDVRADPDYQKKDIDAILQFGDVGRKSFEVKIDSIAHYTRNLFCERLIHRPGSPDSLGWCEKCQADVLCYIIAKEGVAYFVDWPKVREMLDKGLGRSVKSNSIDNEHKSVVEGTLLHIERDIIPYGALSGKKQVYTEQFAKAMNWDKFSWNEYEQVLKKVRPGSAA